MTSSVAAVWLADARARLTRALEKNGRWTTLIWHTKCDPFTVHTTVTRKPDPYTRPEE